MKIFPTTTAEKMRSMLAILTLALVITGLYLSGFGQAADVTYPVTTSLGGTYTVKQVDVGDHHAQAVYSDDYAYQTVVAVHAGTTTEHWIAIPLDAATTGYRHTGTDHLIIKDIDYSSYLYVGSTVTGLYILSYGVVTAQNGATSGTVEYFYHNAIYGNDSMKRPFGCPLDLSLDGSTPKNFIAANEGFGLGSETSAELADGATLPLGGGGAAAVHVGDVIGRAWRFIPSTFVIADRICYRAE